MKMKKIRSFCLSNGSIPKDKHCTLWYNPMRSAGETEDEKNSRLALVEALLARLGEEISYKELEVLSDTNVTCVTMVIEEPTLYRGESLPHVTMEVSDGASPAQSNDLILLHSTKRTADKEAPTHKAVLSVMYYTKGKDGKSVKAYSTNPLDWDCNAWMAL